MTGDFRPDAGQKSEFFSFIRGSSGHRCILSDDDDDSENDGGGSVVLVEELPNAFLRPDNDELADFLVSYSSCAVWPVIFVVSEDSGSGGSGRRFRNLFSDNVLRRANMAKIEFNALAPSFLASAMKRVLDKVEQASRESNKKFARPSDETISAVAELSNGDVRLCLNGLQFACASSLSGDNAVKLFSLDLGDGGNLSMVDEPAGRKKGRRGAVKATKDKLVALKRRKMNAESDEASATASFPLGDRDGKLNLFALLGKILYAKRESDEEAVSRHRERAATYLSGDGKKREKEPEEPLLENPESLVENSPVSPDGLVQFLHQNYVDFLGDVKAVSSRDLHLLAYLLLHLAVTNRFDLVVSSVFPQEFAKFSFS